MYLLSNASTGYCAPLLSSVSRSVTIVFSVTASGVTYKGVVPTRFAPDAKNVIGAISADSKPDYEIWSIEGTGYVTYWYDSKRNLGGDVKDGKYLHDRCWRDDGTLAAAISKLIPYVPQEPIPPDADIEEWEGIYQSIKIADLCSNSDAVVRADVVAVVTNKYDSNAHDSPDQSITYAIIVTDLLASRSQTFPHVVLVGCAGGWLPWYAMRELRHGQAFSGLPFPKCGQQYLLFLRRPWVYDAAYSNPLYYAFVNRMLEGYRIVDGRIEYIPDATGDAIDPKMEPTITYAQIVKEIKDAIPLRAPKP